MGVRLISGEDGETVFYCSTTMWAFGPVFGDPDTAEAFLEWMRPIDVRTLSDAQLTERYLTFLARKRFRVENPKTGHVFGIWDADTEAQALDACARDAGYDDYAAACADDDMSPFLVATEVR